MKLLKKYILIIITIFLIINFQKVKAIDYSGDSGGGGVSTVSGSVYGIKRLGIKVTLVDSNDKPVAGYEPKYYFPNNPQNSDGDIVVKYGGTGNVVPHTVKFNRHTSYTKPNGEVVKMACYETDSSNSHTEGCNMYVYIKAIAQAKDVDLVNFFVSDITGSYANPAPNLSRYYLRIEPYFRLEMFHFGLNFRYYVYGTVYDVLKFIMYGSNSGLDPSTWHIYNKNGDGDGQYRGVTDLYYYEYISLTSLFNIMVSIASDSNFGGNANLPVYATNAELAAFDNARGSSAFPSTWLRRWEGIPNNENIAGISFSKRKKIWYYYANYMNSNASTKSGLAVGYIRISDYIQETCESEFDASGKTMADRISIYEKYKSEADYRNLLDLNITTGSKACTTKVCSYNKQNGCFSTDVARNFKNGTSDNLDDLSCYNEVIEGSGATPDAYCLSSFKLENKLGGSSFLTDSGALIFNVDNVSDPGLVAIGTLQKRCYAKKKVYDVRTYSSYIGNLVVNDGNDWVNVPSQVGTSDTAKTIKAGISTIKYSRAYYLPKLYGTDLSGHVTYTDCDNCRFLGYGIVSKFSDNFTSGTSVLAHTFKTRIAMNNSGVFGSFGYQEGSCVYYSTPKVIIDDKFNLQFRIIDTSNPFPGKDGLGRNTGANWCDEFDCGFANDVVESVILLTNNSYNRDQTLPKYEITLNPDDIKKIREYNSNRKYDDFDFTCDDDRTNCTSNFLTKLINGNLGLSNKLKVN